MREARLERAVELDARQANRCRYRRPRRRDAGVHCEDRRGWLLPRQRREADAVKARPEVRPVCRERMLLVAPRRNRDRERPYLYFARDDPRAGHEQTVASVG